MYYAIRVDVKYQTEDKQKELLQEIIQLSKETLIAIEVADETGKRHYQGYIDILQEDEKKVRNIIRNKLLNKQAKKGDYSLAQVKDITKYAPYILKGEHIVFKENVDEEKFKEYTQKVQEYKEKSKKETMTQVAKYIKWFKEVKIPQYQQDPIQQVPFFNGHRVADAILEFFNLNPDNPPLFMKRNIEMYMCITMNTIARQYAPEEFEKWKWRYVASIYDISCFL